MRRFLPRPTLAAAATFSVGIALIPLAYLGVRVGEAGWARITDELFTARTGALVVRSVALAAVVTAGCTALGVVLAFLVTRTDVPARRLFGVLAALPLAVPSYVAAFVWVSTVDGFEGFWAAALVLTLVSYPYVYLPVAAALAGVDPAQEEVSRSLGRGPWRTAGVTLRQVRPAVGAGALLVALYVLSDFGAVSIVRVDVLTRAVFTSINLGFDRTGALVLATVLVALTAVVLLAEQLTRRRGARYARVGGGAPRPPTRLRLGALRWPAALAFTGVIVTALGVPAASLLRWSVEGVSRPGSIAELATVARNSLGVALLGTALTVLLALPVGLLTTRVPGPLAVALDRLTYLSHALPGLVIGLSLVFFGINVAYPLYQSVWLLALAYAALFLPLAVAAVGSAVAQAPPGLEEVARSLGRRRTYVLRTVTVPLAAPGIGAGAALVFLTCMKELPATLLLRPTGLDTLATELWTQTSVAAYAAAAPYAALLVLIAALPTWWLSARTGVPTRGGG